MGERYRKRIFRSHPEANASASRTGGLAAKDPGTFRSPQGGVLDGNNLEAEFRASVRSSSLAVGYTFVAPSFEQQKSSPEDASSRDSVHLASVKDY